MSERIKLAGGIIRDDQGNILLLHRKTSKLAQWELPGGRVEEGEMPSRTMVRELKEELGVKVTAAAQAGRIFFSQARVDYEYFWYDADIKGKPRVQEPHIHNRLGYFSIEQMKAMQPELSPNVQEFLRQLNLGEISLEP